jgi:hypothetical protein
MGCNNKNNIRFPKASPKLDSKLNKKLETWESEIASSLCFIPADDKSGNDVVGIGLTTKDEVIFAAGFYSICDMQDFIDNVQEIIDTRRKVSGV